MLPAPALARSLSRESETLVCFTHGVPSISVQEWFVWMHYLPPAFTNQSHWMTGWDGMGWDDSPPPGQIRAGLPLQSRRERDRGTAGGEAAHHWAPYSRWHLLHGVSGRVGVEVRESVRRLTEVQRRKVHSGESQADEGELAVTWQQTLLSLTPLAVSGLYISHRPMLRYCPFFCYPLPSSMLSGVITLMCITVRSMCGGPTMVCRSLFIGSRVSVGAGYLK